jgi:outer membrane protein TolC
LQVETHERVDARVGRRVRGLASKIQIEKQIEVANSESAIRTAFKEMSNALTVRAPYVDQVQADRDYVASAQRYYTLAEARYKAGTDAFLTYLDAQRTLFTAQQQLATDSLPRQALRDALQGARRRLGERLKAHR